MVKEKKKINIINLISKYFICADKNFHEKIANYLEELKDIYSLNWVKVDSLISHKSYISKSNIDKNIDLTRSQKFQIIEFANIYFSSAKEENLYSNEEIIESIRLGISVLEEQERNKIIFDLTSEVRKSSRPDIALEKLFSRLNEYLDIKLFCFFLKSEDKKDSFTISFFEQNEGSKLKLDRKKSFNCEDIKNFKDLTTTNPDSNIRSFESKLRNEKFGYLLIEKDSQWIQAQEDLLSLFVEQLAVIQNQHKLNDEILSIVQREFLLNQVTTKVRDSLISSEILEIASQEIGQIMGADSCGIFLKEKTQLTQESKQAIWSAQNKYNSFMQNMLIAVKNTIYKEDKAQLSWCYPNFNNPNINQIIHSFHRDYSVNSFLSCAVMDQANKEIIGFIILTGFNSERDWREKEEELLESLSQQISMALFQAEIYQDAQQTKRQMALLHKLSNDIRNSLDLSIVLSALAKGLGEVLGFNRCFVRMLSEDMQIIKTNEEYTSENISKCADIIFGFEKRWISSLLSRNDLHAITEVLNFRSLRKEFGYENRALVKITDSLKIKSYLSVPLISQNKLLGTITVHQCDRERDFSLEEINFILQIGSEAAVAIKNAEFFDTIDKLSKTDPDTGLYNKKYFNQVAYREIENAKHKHSHMSLMMVDLDYLKTINDTLGHEAGDEAILITATVLTQTLRQTPMNEIQRRIADVVGRYGGDEFIILLPNTDIESAYQAAVRVRKNLAKSKHSVWKQPLTCSIGIAGTPSESYDFNQLKVKADEALYLSKKKGRNAISTSREL